MKKLSVLLMVVILSMGVTSCQVVDTAKESINGAKETIDDAKDSVDMVKEELDNLKKEVKDLTEQKDDILEKFNTAKDELQKFTDENSKLLTENEDLSSMLEASEEKVDSLLKVGEEQQQKNSKKIINPDFIELGMQGNRMSYVLSDTEKWMQSTLIVANSDERIITEFDELLLDTTKEEATVSYKVAGTIYKFQTIVLDVNEKGEIIEKSVEYTKDEVSNTTIYIKSILPEGMPFRKIKWENSAGEVFEDYISYDGYGFDGRIIWCK